MAYLLKIGMVSCKNISISAVIVLMQQSVLLLYECIALCVLQNRVEYLIKWKGWGHKCVLCIFIH